VVSKIAEILDTFASVEEQALSEVAWSAGSAGRDRSPAADLRHAAVSS